MATLDNQNDIILQATDYRFVDPLIELATYDSNSATTIITPKFTKTADVAGLLPSLVVIKATMTNTIGTTASLPTPTQYYWEYSTTTNPNTWIAVSPQPTYGVGYNVGTLQVTNALFKTHVGTGNTGVYYRLTLKYAVENDVVGSRFLVSYVAEANTPPLVELSKPTIFIPTTTSTVDFLNSTFDLNVRVGTTYLRYDASVTPAINTFKVGTGVVRVGTTTIGAMTLADRDKATTNLVSANDTAVFADFSGAGTTDFAVLEYPVTITDIDGNTIAISIQQSLVKQKTGQDGLAGTPGALFEITNSAPVFKKTSAGVFSPTSLTLNTQFLYITGTPTYQWYKNNVAISGAVSNNYVVATADYVSVTTNTYKCTITGTIGGSTSSLSDEVTVPVLADGSNAIQISNSNENITFSGPDTGFSGISFTNGGSVIRVYLGTTLLSYAASGANTFSCTIANTGITVAAGTGTGTTFTIPAPTAMSSNTATTVVTVTIRDSEGAVTTPTTTISYSLSRAGTAGLPGADGADSTVAGPTGNSSRRAYARVPVAEGNPTAVTVNTTGVNAFPPSGSWGFAVTWAASDPTPASTDSLWQTDGILVNSTTVTTWSAPYLSSLKVGTLSAITVDAGSLTAGSLTGLTVTGGTVRTAASGQRVEMAGSTNDLKVYNASSAVILAAGGTGLGASIKVTSSTLTGPAVWGVNTGAAAIFGDCTSGDGVSGQATTGNAVRANCTGTGKAVSATNTSTGNAVEGTASSGMGIWGIATTGTGVKGETSSSGNAVYGFCTSSGLGVLGETSGTSATAHGIRGRNGNKGTSGLVGGANGYNFYAETAVAGVVIGDYGTFTGAHDTLILKNTVVTIGDILVDKQVIGKSNMSNVICESVLSTEPNQKAATGVYLFRASDMGAFFPNGVMELDAWELNSIIDTYDYCAMNSLGEGQVNVCGENGDIEIGDLIVTSSMLGKGMRQVDDIVRNYTVAKAREAVTFSSPNEVKTIACIYLCG